MESNLRNREFEDFVKQNADQYRMFPSEKVWKSVNNTLHTRRKWYGLGLGFLLLLTGTAVTWVMISYPVAKNNEVVAVTTKPGNTTPQQHFSVADNPVTTTKNDHPTALPPFANSVNAVRPVLDIDVQNAVVESVPALQETEEAAVLKNEKLPSIAVNAPGINSVSSNTFADVFIAEQPAVVAYTKKAEESKPTVTETAAIEPALFRQTGAPLTIESVINTYTPPKGKQIIWQVFITPTVSYRKLDENKSFDSNSGLTYPFASLTDVNKAVTHKPDMGLQIGLSAAYPINRTIRIRGGFQFNINRYDIKAFPYNPEVATINLSDPSGISSVSTVTPYRSYGSFKSDWLKNFYFSVSAPVGIELRLFGNKKSSFGVAGTVQPTYIVKDRAYLISTDYKNYAEVPWLIRHVNVNTGFEAFVNYTNGKTHWQIGPQVRYQLMSSFHNKYPVKENLFDFGIRVGVSLNE